jgi:sarcosine oxidase gamma subunit
MKKYIAVKTMQTVYRTTIAARNENEAEQKADRLMKFNPEDWTIVEQNEINGDIKIDANALQFTASFIEIGHTKIKIMTDGSDEYEIADFRHFYLEPQMMPYVYNNIVFFFQYHTGLYLMPEDMGRDTVPFISLALITQYIDQTF